ncbi:Mitogen-activated protein kinase kinase kinase 2 [Phytophthora citrophthora]|uniref:Mitogen-activated protein kinase kinase kinase 2 n=1 Tax=Phytophthora citrophthora TaxID=4793 RepID=A0AAD9GB13_9STRA|nr:Mitogen-activated protein kinase kinase kinase 2 [Phytophthora citrophthora]
MGNALMAEARKHTSDPSLLDFAIDQIPSGPHGDLYNLSRAATDRPTPSSWGNDTTTSLDEPEVPATSDEADEKGGRKEEEEEEDYSNDEFEDDEVTEWKKGSSIGAGSYGTVFLARDEDTGCLMAVKEILISEETETAVREATREVELLRSLKHENIVKYLGCHVDTKAQTLSIFTEWVPGGSLEHNRKLFGGNERVVRRFTHQLLSGVAYLHSKNIIHHDIKPANILVDQNGVVKIADFGSSRLINSATMASGSTRSLHGTPNYMAPEVIKQTAGRSQKADIWSIGCTVLRLLTGGPLWGDRRFDCQAALLYYIANLEELPPLPDSLSAKAREFILACLQIDTSMRPSASELLTYSFVQCAGHRSEPISPEPVAPRRHTAPSVPSADSHKSLQYPRRSERTPAVKKETPKETDPDSPTLERRPSFVAKLFAQSLAQDEPAKETAVLITPVDCEELILATRSGDSTASTEDNSDLVVTCWDDQPILTAAARKDREKRQLEDAEAARRRQEREQKFQEELAAYRHDSFAGRA